MAACDGRHLGHCWRWRSTPAVCYFQRRADAGRGRFAGALAAPRNCVGTVANPNGVPNQALYTTAGDHLRRLSLAAIGQATDSAYTQPSVTQTQGGYTVTTVAPTGYTTSRSR